MIILVLLVSFVLEGILSIIIPTNSLFIPIFSIIALATVYPLFKDNRIKYLIYASSLGLLYDIVYTNTPFTNTLSFLVTAYIISLIYEYIKVSKFNILLIDIIVILFYQTFSYMFLCILSYSKFNETTFIENLYSSLISNVIYGLILYIILEIFRKKRRII